MSSANSRARALARRARSLADPKMRVAYLRHELRRMEPADAADLLLITAARAEGRHTEYEVLMLGLSLALADPDSADLREAIEAQAEARGRAELAVFLRKPPDDSKAVHPRELPDSGTSRPLTLGERKALARRGSRDLIAHALRDPHPEVMRILLQHSKLTEEDLLRLCARRDASPEVLREVFRSTRWICRVRVRRALVHNPACPLDVSLQLAVHLHTKDAREVSASPDLDITLRRACARDAADEPLH